MVDQRGIYENGIYRVGEVRISDLAGRKILPIGSSNFAAVVESSVFIDKSMLIADVLDGGSSVMLFCRPRRFGKSLNLNMLQRFFEAPLPDGSASVDIERLFSGLAIWSADGGRFREHAGAYPVIRFSFNDLKPRDEDDFEPGIALSVAGEYRRHGYLVGSDKLNEYERRAFDHVASGNASVNETRQSLRMLTELLCKHYGRRTVVLIDEYDAPVMAGCTYGYYERVVGFLKSWLTGALKDNDALAFGVLTGVQRITKESIFSDLNNLTVSTALNVVSDERYGFTQAEMDALAAYLEREDGLERARRWYDGYRFGSVDVYNPWSVLNYFRNGCQPDVYWGNTSGNAVLGDMVRGADDCLLGKLYRLMEPQGAVEEPLDLGIVFPDIGIREGALWSMLYLAGYVTTDDTELPNDTELVRSLRVPNEEVSKLFKGEIVRRFAKIAGGRDDLAVLHRALKEGDAETLEAGLERVLLTSASFFDLKSENSCHMLMLGLLFSVAGYASPESNRESGRGRFDIQLAPIDCDRDPLITIEIKFARQKENANLSLRDLAAAALVQIADRSYDVAGSGVAGSLRYGIAFDGKNVAVALQRVGA